MSGFAALRREALDHPLFAGEAARLGAWAWLILTACWKPTKFDIHGKTVTLERGQLCASRHQLADAWGWSPSAVERFLTRLQTEQMIGRATGQGRSIITICNYAKYQDVPEQAGQATGQPTGQAADKQRTAKEQGNNIPLSNDNGAGDFWAFAVGYLGEKRRSLIGKWRRDYSEPEVISAIAAAQFAKAMEPVSYIEKTLRAAKADAGEMW